MHSINVYDVSFISGYDVSFITGAVWCKAWLCVTCLFSTISFQISLDDFTLVTLDCSVDV